MSVRLSVSNNSAPTGRIFVKFGIWVLSENLPRKFQLHSNLSRITATLRKHLFTFTISCPVLLTIRNDSAQIRGENQNTNLVLNKFPENRAVYETMSQNMVEPDRPQMTICTLYFARLVTNATNTHWQYIIRFAFPRQPCRYERAQCYVLLTLRIFDRGLECS
jgi:hypothetical protein